MARNKKVEILSNGQEVLHPITDGDCVIFSDGRTLTQKLSEDDSVKYTPEVTNSSPMFKVGEGNTVDYSANVLDGAYERATLQGQTYVNYIQESSADEITLPTPFTEYERTQHNTLTSNEEGTLGINLVGQSYVNALQHDSEESYVVLGENLEFQEKKVEYTNEGQIKSAMLKGQTLVNLAKNPSMSISKTDDEALVQKYTLLEQPLDGIKPNTKYLVRFNVTTNTQSINGANYGVMAIKDGAMYSNESTIQVGELGIHTCFLTTFNTEANVIRFRLYMAGNTSGGTVTINNLIFIEYQEGMENWDIPYFEGMQSVTVSTKLENLCHTYYDGKSTNDFKVGKTFTVKDANSRAFYIGAYNTYNPINMRPNTKYLIQFQVSNLVLDGASYLTLTFSDSTLSSGNCMFGQGTSIQVSQNGIYRYVATTTNVVDTSSIVIKGGTTEWEQSNSTLRSLTISNIMYVEYQNGMENWDLPYFEDYQVMKPVQVKSFNKNIIDFYDSTLTSHGVTATITNGVWKITGTSDSDGGRNATYRYSTILKANKTYVFTLHDLVENKDSVPGIYVSNSTTGTAILKVGLEGGIVKTESNYTPTEDTLVHVWFNRYTGATYDTTFKLMLEESDTATSYVPHQSKTTYSWDEVILRKVGDVEDTLDLTTGEWVQRIGEVVFDGSDDEIWLYDRLNTDVFVVRIALSNTVGVSGGKGIANILCKDYVSMDGYNLYNDNVEGIAINGRGEINLAIKREKLIGNTTDSVDVSHLKTYLQSNPVTVQYELNTPIVHKVNLSRPNLQVYDDITHVHTKCLDGTLIPNIYLPAEVSYAVGVEPETVYNVCVNHEVSSSNPLVCNVGGSTFTVTQPRTLITVPQGTKTISFSGKDNVISEVMMIKNSSLLTRDLPHFNGVSSVQLGKTITNLCGSSAMMVGNANIAYTVKKDSIDMTVNNAGSAVWIFSLLTTLKSDKKYFVYAPNTYPGGCASFRGVKNGTLGYGHEATAWTGKKHCIITPKQNVDFPYTHLCVGQHDGFGIVTVTLQRPIICEYEQGMENWDWESIGYFTGTKNIGNEFMRLQNKNLFDGVFIQGSIGSRGQDIPYHKDSANHKRSNFIAVESSTQYTLSYFNYGNPMVFEYDESYNLLHHYNHLKTFTTQPNTQYIRIRVSNDETGSTQLEESSTATTYTAHKHNSLYVRKDQPIDLTWEQGRINPSGVGDSYTNAINNTVSYGVRNKGLLNLKPNTTYRLSLGDTTTYKWHIALFDNWDCALQANNLFGLSGDWSTAPETFITTTKDYHKIGINIQRQDSGSLSASTAIPCRLEEVEEIKLRSASGKYDELDITRGKYIQRVGELYIDGSNIASQTLTKVGDAYQPTDTTLNTYDVRCPGAIFSARVHINHFAPRNGGTESPSISYESAAIHSANQSCRITISKSKASTLEEFKAWLSKNPLTIVYALTDSSEIEHDIVFIGNKNELGTEIAKPNGVFTLPTLYAEQTHIELQNNGLMPKVQSRDYIAYPALPMINRTYTLQHNLIGGVSNLTIDLLGRTQSVSYQNHKSLVYTPETMGAKLHHELRISGKGKIGRVMYIDGGYMDRDIPYIEGMKNAVNPTVKNIGKNLYHNSNSYIFNDGQYIGTKEYHKKPTFILQRNTNYTMTFESSSNDGRIYGYNDGVFIGYLGEHSSGGKTVTFNTGNCNGISFYRQVPSGLTLDYKITLSEVQTTDEYKENICYVDCGEIRLTEDMFEQGSIYSIQAHVGLPYANDKTNGTARIRTKDLIELNPNEKYVFLGDPNYYYSMHFYDRNGLKVAFNGVYDLAWKGHIPFTTPTDAPMAAIFICKANQGNITPSELQHINVQLVKVSEIKPLRSLPNGVHDEIDLETGKYIQRVGEITFNGTENWNVGYSSWDNKRTYYNSSFVDIKTMKGDDGSGNAYYDAVRCPQLHRSYMSRLANALIDGVCSYYYSGYQRIFISKQDCVTVDELKLWLQENPITVQYELPEPIVKDIVIHNYPHSYEGGHVIIENGDPNTPVPAKITYRAVTNRSGQIQQHTEQVEKQGQEINELEMLILANISNQTRS